MASKSGSYRDGLMKGRTRVESKASSNIVRVFLSSTFADMSDERNVLYNKAYPELRNFCQNLGLEFQAIDMRWGVRDTASVDHSTTALCLLEVKTCKKVSLGPYFVVFLGNRYGYQPLPNAIKDSEFKALYQIASEQGEGKEKLLDTWYKLDLNNLPSARILEPITSHFPHFDDTNPEYAEKRDADREGWNEVFRELSSLLKATAEIAVKRGILEEKSQLNFKKSITHMEVEEALEEHGNGTLLAYSREISDIQKHTKEDKAKLFIDLVDEDRIDKSKQKMLRALKRMVKLQVEGKKVFKRYGITWDSLNQPDNEEKLEGGYLQKFCEDFLSDMKTSIAIALASEEKAKKNDNSEDALLEEVIHHAGFEYLKTVDFCGREQLISDISDLIAKRENNRPIVLVGKSGCGKTSLMAKLIDNQRNLSPGHVIIYRFLGTSPDSSNIHKLLTSLIFQLSTVYEEELPASHVLKNFPDVVEIFATLLNRVSKRIADKEGHYLVIFLDSIDQLSVEDGAHRMVWLPKTTPDKVTIVLSSLPEPDFEIVPTMRKYVADTNIHEVRGLTIETAKEILEKCLSNEGRQLTQIQSEKILKAFEKSPYPLFLKLMLEEAKRWKSHDTLDGLELPETAKSAISRFYERMEKEHGKTFTSRAIGYIVAARDGVTENELQDLLSLDDEVMHDVYEHWSPPLENSARIPPFTWTRLNYDLSKYIVQRQATGHTVLALYHRQFIEVAREKYLQPSDAAKVYKTLSEYFQGVYADGIPKQLKLKMWEESREVDRRVAKQPNQFSRNVFNVRKLRELPFSLLKAKSLDMLKERVLGNPSWILTKIEAFSIKEVLEDYNLVLGEIDDPEVKLIRDAIQLAKPTLEFPAGVKNSLFTELFCRLEFFSEEFPNCLGSLVKQCGDLLNDDRKEILSPLNGYFQPPGGPLRTTVTGLKTPVTCLEFLFEENIFAAGSKDGCLMIWDTNNDGVVHKIEAHSGPIATLAFNETKLADKVASCSGDKSVKMFLLDSGNECFHQTVDELENSKFTKLFFTKDLLIVILDYEIVAWNTTSKEQIFKVELSVANTYARFTACSQIQLVIVGQENGGCQSFDARTGEKIATSEPYDDEVQAIFTSHDEVPSAWVVVWKGGRIAFLDINTLEVKDSLECGNGDVADSCKSRFEPKFAVAAGHKVELLSFESGKIKIDCTLGQDDSAVSKIRFVDKTNMAVAYANKKVIIWEFTNNDEPERGKMWEGMGAPIHLMEIGENVGVTGSNKVFYLKVWDLKHEDIVKIDPALPLYSNTSTLNSSGDKVSYVENGRIVTQGVGNYNTARLGRKLVLPGFDASGVVTTKFDAEGNSLLVARNDGSLVRLRADDTGGETMKSAEEARFEDAESRIQLLTVSHNENEAVIVCTPNAGGTTIIRLNVKDLSLVRRFELTVEDVKGSITTICCNKKGILLGTSEGYIYDLAEDKEEEERAFQMKVATSQHGSAITCLTMSHNGDLVFSGSKGRTRRLWELRNANLILKHELHIESLLQGGVTSAQFTHDDKHVITGSNERVITIWNCQTGALIGSQYVYAPVLDVVVTEDSKLIYTSELGYVAVAKFRPPVLYKKSSVKIKRDQSKSSSCQLM